MDSSRSPAGFCPSVSVSVQRIPNSRQPGAVRAGPFDRIGGRIIFHALANALLDLGAVGVGGRRDVDHRAVALLGIGHHAHGDAAVACDIGQRRRERTPGGVEGEAAPCAGLPTSVQRHLVEEDDLLRRGGALGLLAAAKACTSSAVALAFGTSWT